MLACFNVRCFCFCMDVVAMFLFGVLAEVCLLLQDDEADLRGMYPVFIRELLHLLPCHLCAPGWGGDEACRLAVRRVGHVSQAQTDQRKGKKKNLLLGTHSCSRGFLHEAVRS